MILTDHPDEEEKASCHVQIDTSINIRRRNNSLFLSNQFLLLIGKKVVDFLYRTMLLNSLNKTCQELNEKKSSLVHSMNHNL